jgi:dihydrofolate synthase / folylpolyglutamate synthase
MAAGLDPRQRSGLGASVADYAAALARLYTLAGRGKRLELGAMQTVCDAFGNPERAFRAVHVAGTNGKGTVSAFVAAMLRAQGTKVGLYTSPHLIRFSERIRVGNDPVPDDILARLIFEVLEAGPQLTFFEVTTLVAFLAFRELGVQTAVLEVGLGGRLDATNVIPPPDVAVITRVAFDHTAELGGTLAQIAGEKAGIIKAGCKVVLGKLHPEALTVIKERVAEVGAEIVPLGSPEPIPGAPLAYPRLSMVGTNLAVAVTVGRTLGIEPTHLARGVETIHWPGRNELLHRNRKELTLLDCAHNADGAVALAHSLDPQLLDVESRRDIALVFGSVVGKNYRAMLKRLEPCAAHRVYVAPPVERAEDPKKFAEVLPGEVAPTVKDALRRARELAGVNGVVVVTGSVFLVGRARAILLDLPSDPPIGL